MIFGQISKKNKERCKQKSTVLGVIWFLRIFTVAVMLYIVYGIIQGKAFGLAGWTSIPFVYLRYSPRRWLAYHMVTLIPAAIMFLCLCIRKRTCYYAVLGFCYAEIIAALGKMYKSYSGYQFTYLLTNPTQRAQWDSKGGYWGLAGEIFAIWVALFVLFLIVQYFWRKTPVFAYYARSENTDVRPKKTMLKSLCLMFLITFIGGETMGIPSHKSNNAKYNIVDAENKIFVHTFPTQPYIKNESIMDIYGPDTDLKVLEIL